MPEKIHALTVKAKDAGMLNVIASEDIEIFGFEAPPVVKVIGIWDTGATGSVITTKVINLLGIKPSGIVEVHTANGTVLKNTYDINIKLPNNVIVNNVVATEADALSGGCDALIGMDIITLGDFSITNYNNSTCMSFRMPSQKEVDFVKQVTHINTIIENHIKSGRTSNSKCICGSGKKFKNCHGKNT